MACKVMLRDLINASPTLTSLPRFLWVAFQVDELGLQHCDDDIRKAIRNLPKDLEETFDRAVGRIVSRGNENIAQRVPVGCCSSRASVARSAEGGHPH